MSGVKLITKQVSLVLITIDILLMLVISLFSEMTELALSSVNMIVFFVLLVSMLLKQSVAQRVKTMPLVYILIFDGYLMLSGVVIWLSGDHVVRSTVYLYTVFAVVLILETRRT